MQKMARDRMRQFGKDAKAGHAGPRPGHEEETALCAQLGSALAAAKGDKKAEAAIWDAEWRSVYGLAEAIMKRTLTEVAGPMP